MQMCCALLQISDIAGREAEIVTGEAPFLG
jgi:hypothetical protein